MPADGLGKGGGVAGRWVDGKKYKSGTGNWEIFSWKEPTGGQRGLTKYKKIIIFAQSAMLSKRARLSVLVTSELANLPKCVF